MATPQFGHDAGLGLVAPSRDAAEIARDDWRSEPANRDVLATLGADLWYGHERDGRDEVDLEQRRRVGKGSCSTTTTPDR